MQNEKEATATLVSINPGRDVQRVGTANFLGEDVGKIHEPVWAVIGNLGASIQAIFVGNISLYTNLCERAREEAFNLMLTHAGQLGANAVIGVRYDATEIAAGITEVLCYSTAVYVEAETR